MAPVDDHPGGDLRVGPGRLRQDSLSRITLAVLGLALTTTACDRPTFDKGVYRYALPPTSSEKIRRLVDPGATPLPGGYRFTGANIDKTVLIARYESPSRRRFTLRLVHPRTAPRAHRRTRRFAIQVLPPGLPGDADQTLDVLVARIRRNEPSWQWKRITVVRSRSKRTRWTRIVSIYLLLLLLAGVGGNWLLSRRGSAAPEARSSGWTRGDAIAMGVITLLGLARLWNLGALPIHGDEARLVEPDFWSTWFLGHETLYHPPLFRFVTHLITTTPEHLWLLRLPSVLCSVVSLVILYRLVRSRAHVPVAVVVTVVVGLQVSQILWAQTQKGYACWLLLLLLTTRSALGALAGCERQWGWFGLWAFLTSLTHYFTPFYLLGLGVYVVLRRRDQWTFLWRSAAPAALALIPFVVLVATRAGHFDNGPAPSEQHGWWALQWHQLSHVAGLLGVLIMLPALFRRQRRGETVLLYLVVGGLMGIWATGWRGSLWGRYYVPILPLLLLWIVSQLAPRWRDWRLHQVASVALGALMIISPGLRSLIRRHTHQDRPGMAALLAYREAAVQPRYVLLYPAWLFEVAVLEKYRRRDYWHRGCNLRPPPRVFHGKNEILFALDTPAGPAGLDRALRRLGRFEVLRLGADPPRQRRDVARWLDRRCARIRQVKPTHYGRAIHYRCGSTPRTPTTLCRVFGPEDDRGGP